MRLEGVGEGEGAREGWIRRQSSTQVKGWVKVKC